MPPIIYRDEYPRLYALEVAACQEFGDEDRCLWRMPWELYVFLERERNHGRLLPALQEILRFVHNVGSGEAFATWPCVTYSAILVAVSQLMGRALQFEQDTMPSILVSHGLRLFTRSPGRQSRSFEKVRTWLAQNTDWHALLQEREALTAWEPCAAFSAFRQHLEIALPRAEWEEACRRAGQPDVAPVRGSLVAILRLLGTTPEPTLLMLHSLHRSLLLARGHLGNRHECDTRLGFAARVFYPMQVLAALPLPAVRVGDRPLNLKALPGRLAGMMVPAIRDEAVHMTRMLDALFRSYDALVPPPDLEEKFAATINGLRKVNPHL